VVKSHLANDLVPAIRAALPESCLSRPAFCIISHNAGPATQKARESGDRHALTF
jgi:hypothetical protein